MKKHLVNMAESKASQLMKLLDKICNKVNTMNDNMMLLNDNMIEIDGKLEKILKKR